MYLFMGDLAFLRIQEFIIYWFMFRFLQNLYLLRFYEKNIFCLRNYYLFYLINSLTIIYFVLNFDS